MQLPHRRQRDEEEIQITQQVERTADVADHDELVMTAGGKTGFDPALSATRQAEVAVNDRARGVHGRNGTDANVDQVTDPCVAREETVLEQEEG